MRYLPDVRHGRACPAIHVFACPVRPLGVARATAEARPRSRCARRESRQPALAAAVMLDGVVVLVPGAAEIEFLDVRVLLQRLRRAVHDDAAVLDEIGVADDVERRRGILLDQENADAVLVEAADDAKDLVYQEARKP